MKYLQLCEHALEYALPIAIAVDDAEWRHFANAFLKFQYL